MKPLPLLQVQSLCATFRKRRAGDDGAVRAVDGVSFTLSRGDSLGLVGESGAGKSTLARCLVGLTRASAGRILIDGEALDSGSRKQRVARRRRIQLVFQDPTSALSPRRTVADTLREPLQHFNIGTPADRGERIRSVLADVGLEPDCLLRYPRHFSSGQRQRIALARALVANPDLLVADEVVSALDVSVQAQILRLLDEVRRRRGLTILLISHDLAVIRHMSERIGVMHRGRLVELGATDDIIGQPAHPYTQQLLACVRRLPGSANPARALPDGAVGLPPPRQGCSFAGECPQAYRICRTSRADWTAVSNHPGHHVECHLYTDRELNG